MPIKYLCLIVVMTVTRPAFAGESPSLQDLLKLAYQNNLGVQASWHAAEAEDALVTAKGSLDDPMVGFSTLDRGMETHYGTISQKILFPNKYFLKARAQRSRANSMKSELAIKQLEIRQQVTTLYYAIFSTQKIIQLTQANMSTVQEFARVAEKKYSAGQAPQGDSMKAHFELTQLELDLIRFKQEEQGLQAQLAAVLNVPSLQGMELAQLKIPAPEFYESKIPTSSERLGADLQQGSPALKVEAFKLNEAQYQSSLAKWNYAPDFQLQYQQRISGEPIDSHIFTVGLSFPLWIWKQNAEASAASLKKLAQEFQLLDTQQQLMANVKDLKGKVSTGAKTLKIYKTSLIPQAQGAFNSSRSAYQANRTSFLDLLDSERSLYRVKTGYYQSLRQYVATLSELESQLGYIVSDLTPKIEVQK